MVSCCGDGDVVEIGEGDGDACRVGERRKSEKVDANLQLCRKGSFRTRSVRPPHNASSTSGCLHASGDITHSALTPCLPFPFG